MAILGDFGPSLERPLALDARLSGIRDALIEAGVDMPTPIPLTGLDWDPEHGRTAMADYLRANPVPEALLALNDRLAFGALQALGDRVSPGRDFSVVSFDNSELAQWMTPPLATLQLPYYEMGRRAMISLLDGDLTSGAVPLPMLLARRDSLRPPPA